MKMTLFSILLAGSVFGWVACVSKSQNSTMPPSGAHSDSCSTHLEHHYEVYLPERTKKCSELPLLVVIDPHGQGKKALATFKMAADRYQLMVVASNTLRNNYPDFITAMDELIGDVKKKYPVGEALYLAGFSGGARMALAYAGRHPVQGTWVSGALADIDQLQQIHSPVVVLDGMADFNFIEAAQYIFQPASAPGNLFIEFTQMEHTWPDSMQITNTLGYLVLRSAKGKCKPSAKWVKTYCQNQEQQIASSQSSENFLQAALVARNMARIPEFNKQMDYLRLQQSIEQDASFKSELNQLQESIRFELNIRKEYSRALQRENITWWQPEIDTLKKRTDESRDPYHRLALQRIKGFLGILSYTLCNQCIQLENYSDLERLLPIYEYLEPRNPDMFYFKACLAWEKGQEKAAVAALQQSVENGFCDWQRMTAEFPQKLLQQLPDSRREL